MKFAQLSAALLFSLFGAGIAANAFADDFTVTGAKVQSVGCYGTKPNSGLSCFVRLDLGVGTCATGSDRSSVRWDASTSEGHNALSVFTAAYLSGRPVSVRSTTCQMHSGTMYPVLDWVAF